MSLVLASLLYIASEGLLGLVWEKDITKLSFLLLDYLLRNVWVVRL